ncbi:MAG: hypothetical protein IPK27_04235 [Rhodanobacteraceae bacterium]|nr:hypothetical protein [Rhodanobacteraceae bacterium]
MWSACNISDIQKIRRLPGTIAGHLRVDTSRRESFTHPTKIDCCGAPDQFCVEHASEAAIGRSFMSTLNA